MKILFITGDEHAAMRIEQDYGLDNAEQRARENGGTVVINDETVYAEIAIQEFGDVDVDFVDFVVNNFIDYDDSKTTNFWVIEE